MFSKWLAIPLERNTIKCYSLLILTLKMWSVKSYAFINTIVTYRAITDMHVATLPCMTKQRIWCVHKSSSDINFTPHHLWKLNLIFSNSILRYINIFGEKLVKNNRTKKDRETLPIQEDEMISWHTLMKSTKLLYFCYFWKLHLKTKISGHSEVHAAVTDDLRIF